MKKKKEHTIPVISICILLILAVFTAVLTIREASHEETRDTERHTKVIIYTYTGEYYTAQGKANINSDTENSDLVIELKGEIKQQKDVSRPDYWKDAKDAVHPSLLRVYMGEQIYGFYSRHTLKLRRQNDENVIEMYGYLEGYSEGEDQNSSIGTVS